MGTLLLVRHGQASFLSDDYDVLSPKGEDQMRELGKYWVQHGFKADRVVTGPLKRQRHSADLVAEAFAAAGLPWPETEVIDDWAELPAEQMAQTFIPLLAAEDDRARELLLEFEQTGDISTKEHVFQEIFVKTMERWVTGDIADPGIIKWPDFCARVQNAVATAMRNGAADGNVVAFTSGGPKAATIHLALGTDPVKTMELAWQSRNGSLTEFTVGPNGLTLNSFNNVPHLPDPNWWTLR
jgi:broad specificity phosphatase PhoE